MTTQIVFDFACPESRILIHRLFAQKSDLQVELLPLRLDPLAPADYGHSTVEHLCVALDISEAQARELLARTEARFSEFGLTADFDKARGCNTLDAHVMARLAHQVDRQLECAALIFEAHFAEGKLISDLQVLVEIGEQIGIDRNLVLEGLNSAEGQLQVLELESDLISRGVAKTPTVLLDGEVAENSELL